MNLVVHYTPFESRTAIFRHMYRLLKPGGRILITNQVLTSDVQLQWLNLWGEMTEGCGPLPSLAEMTAHLRDAGFARITHRRLVPGMGFFSFLARKPE